MTLDEKFDEFRIDCVQRLARIEANQVGVTSALISMNARIDRHAEKLEDHGKLLTKFGVIAALVAAVVSAAWHFLIGR